jgi:HAE1 family hydrophobic/amphiphilic exporter-1
MAIPGGMIIPIVPPSIQGIGEFGGFAFQVLDQTGSPDISVLESATRTLVQQGNQTPGLSRLFTQFTANDPQLLVTLDRERAKALGLNLSDITSTLQVFMGSVYVNDFDLGNRAYRVYVQADQQFRATPADLRRFYVRGPSGAMTRLDELVTVTETTSPQIINHYNLFRSAEITGSPAPGYSSGDAIRIMSDVAERNLPAGVGYEWSGLSREEIEAGQQAIIIFGLGLLFAYLVLAAQYESLVLPFIIMLSVPLAVLGALLAQWGRGLINDVYCQIGLLMLIGLSAKNGILVVEFAEQLRARGLSIVEAAIEAAHIRLRPILMTSMAFILGVLPLALATGAGRAARNSVGTAVVGGMLVSTFLNLALIPVLYIVVRTATERLGRRAEATPPVEAQEA